MPISAHNPDQYMAALRQILGQGRKRIGLLIGAGAPCSITEPSGSGPLIPAIAGLTNLVLAALRPKYEKTLEQLVSELGPNANIETILSRSRSLAAVLGTAKVYGLDSCGFLSLSSAICEEIGRVVNKSLPPGKSPYSNIVSWISGTGRAHPVEIFTTNYDLLFEQALERQRAAYFDGFVGAHEPFFDPSTVASNDAPTRWTRLWKLHGSLGWSANISGAVVRLGGSTSTHLIYPESQKYDQTTKAPYSALFDRLRRFLSTADTLLICSGFSFADAHVSAVIDECLSSNASASVFAFQFKSLAEEAYACALASRRSNFSVYSPDGAMISGIGAPWMPGDLPTRDWGPIRATYWGGATGSESFLLGQFNALSEFFVSVNTAQFALPGTTP